MRSINVDQLSLLNPDRSLLCEAIDLFLIGVEKQEGPAVFHDIEISAQRLLAVRPGELIIIRNNRENNDVLKFLVTSTQFLANSKTVFKGRAYTKLSDREP